MYAIFFTYHNLLPDAIGRQNPVTLFKMLESLDGGEPDIDGNEYLEMFYGKG